MDLLDYGYGGYLLMAAPFSQAYFPPFNGSFRHGEVSRRFAKFHSPAETSL